MLGEGNYHKWAASQIHNDAELLPENTLPPIEFNSRSMEVQTFRIYLTLYYVYKWAIK